MICQCGEQFECYHKFNLGEAWCNHCLKCGKGAGGDMCKGICPACFDEETEATRFQMEEWIKKNKPS